MKKRILLVLIFSLCLTMAACAKEGKPAAGTGNSAETVIDPLDEPVIQMDAEGVTRENRYNAGGSHVGYYQYTTGTNCGETGNVLVEFLDLNGNVLNSFAPKLAGCTLGCGQFGGFDHGQFELTDIWESDYNKEGVTSNEYKLVPYSGGRIYSYIENRKGCTARCDLYGNAGQVVATLTPADPKNMLYIDNIFLYTEPGFYDHFYVTEGYIEGDTRYTTRKIYYDMQGTLLADFRESDEKVKIIYTEYPVRVECRNKQGELVRTLEASVEGGGISAYYDDQTDVLMIYEYLGADLVSQEYCATGTYKTICRMQNIYENGQFSHTQMEICGGQVVLTPSEYKGYYKKVEFYDAQGVLRKTAEATEQKPYIYLSWDQYDSECEIMWIDTEGNNLGYDVYKPR